MILNLRKGTFLKKAKNGFRITQKKGKRFVLRRKHCKIQFIARNQGTM